MSHTRRYVAFAPVRHMTPRTVIDFRKRRAERTRQEILRAGLKIFSEKGFHAATMDDIALELEATKGLLYHHFRTKEALLSAILAENDVDTSITLLFEELRPLPLREALEKLATLVLGFMGAHRQLVRFLHVHALLSTAGAELVYGSIFERLNAGLAAQIDAWQEKGFVRRDLDARAVSRAMVDALIAYFLKEQTFATSPELGQGYVAQLVELWMRGVATDAPRRAPSRSRSTRPRSRGRR